MRSKVKTENSTGSMRLYTSIVIRLVDKAGPCKIQHSRNVDVDTELCDSPPKKRKERFLNELHRFLLPQRSSNTTNK